MNKTVMTLLTAVLMLTACGDRPEEKSNKATKESEQSVQNVNEQTDQQGNEQQEGQNQLEENPAQGEWTSLPEYEEIMKHVDEQDYTFKTVTDNENKRILLLINKNGREQYKTIFIKNDNRLKIIKIDGGGQVFNEKIS